MSSTTFDDARRLEIVRWMVEHHASAPEAIRELELDVAPRTLQIWRKRYADQIAVPERPSRPGPPWAGGDPASKWLALNLLKSRLVELLEAELVKREVRDPMLEEPVPEEGRPLEDDGDAMERQAKALEVKLERAVALLVEGSEAYTTKQVAAHLGLTQAQVRGALVRWWADQDIDAAQLARKVGVSAAVLRKWRSRADRPPASESMELRESAAGVPCATFANACEVFKHDPWWSGRLRWCQFSSRVLYRDGASEDWVELRDEHERAAEKWLADTYRMDVSSKNVHSALLWWAEQHPVHPVRAYLDDLLWDGIPRVDRLFLDYFVCEPDGLSAVLARKWMISAVARIFEPGCQVDTMLTLAGQQGARKSTGLAALAGTAWFSDAAMDLRAGADAALLLQGRWFYEFAELDGMRRSEVTTVKAFLTRKDDRFRAPYGHNTESHPRQTVLVATTNEAKFLADSTGNRRFWVREIVGDIDIRAIRRDRDQLWAEAVRLYRRGRGRDFHWWLTPEEQREADEVAALYEQAHPWQETIEEWLASQVDPRPTTGEVLANALGKPAHAATGPDGKRVASIMQRLGFRNVRARTGTSRRHVWVPR
ncbi:MAG: hypothetical protein KC621_26305 [Myxococcales bacterium]|nr:hypothetical protein [Myxococcales bacterium]